MTNIQENIEKINTDINTVLRKYNRPTNAVTLLAVSKTRSTQEILTAAASGQQHFGENYLQEALPKIAVLSGQPLIWHFIGRIQSRKAKIIAQHFSWAQSVDSLEIAKILNSHRPNQLPPLNICLQININDPNKAGIALDQVENFVAALTNRTVFPNLKLRGLMTITAVNPNPEQQLIVYSQLAAKYHKLIADGYHLDTLSMGMSDDYLVAVAAGANLVRIGSAIFGPRSKP